MSRYIDKDKILDNLNWFAPEPYKDSISNFIEEQPEADVVKVVRCKDCEYSRSLCNAEKQIYGDDCVGCIYLSTGYNTVVTNRCDYCSYGERKENEQRRVFCHIPKHEV